MNEALERRVTKFVARHDAHVRAAVQLACTSALRHKIGVYVDPDGWIEWDRLAADIAEGLPWSSGEKRLGRLACSLAGQTPDRLDDEWSSNAWSLADMLNGLDPADMTATLDAITLAASGRPPRR